MLFGILSDIMLFWLFRRFQGFRCHFSAILFFFLTDIYTDIFAGIWRINAKLNEMSERDEMKWIEIKHNEWMNEWTNEWMKWHDLTWNEIHKKWNKRMNQPRNRSMNHWMRASSISEPVNQWSESTTEPMEESEPVNGSMSERFHQWMSESMTE